MKKKIIEHIANNLPDFFNNAKDYLKEYFDENGQKLAEKTTGTIGLLVGLFAQPLIDKYFNNLRNRKLQNFGFDIYLKSSLIQANESLSKIANRLDSTLTPDVIFEILNDSIKREISTFDKLNIILIFQPKHHPVVEYVKNNYVRILRELSLNQVDIKLFIKDFNDNIETTVAKEFGLEYEGHLKQTEEFRLKENETTFLWDTILQAKIGFKETENLKYEITYAKWDKVSNLRDNDNTDERDNSERDDDESNERDDNESDERDDNDEIKRNSIFPVEELIEEYFSNTTNQLEKILFVIADFGKGKSVFMKYYAAKLAKEYLETSDAYFPIYFNLRNFKHYSTDPRLGIISDYLETKYSIKIDDDYFKKKKYIFLIDSLDESGELNKRNIDRVISSVKSIQNIDKTRYKQNRIIMTSRPFDEGLAHHLYEHKPLEKKNEENRVVSYFIRIYGFTKDQFNDWLYETIRKSPEIIHLNTSGFAKKIIDAISNNKKIDVHQELLKNRTLSESELRRPIFAYMIYQLIINNVDFLAVGKIGVYLSFLNLLTKEAKHIHDVNYKVNLKEEFEFRNILHATSALWMYERQKGKQGTLKKADICRTLEGENRGETDSEILERLKGEYLTEIHFLSHSYFGENDNVLHFQHQSFAEILLAEYYLKIFIKYGFDKDADKEEARIRLILGEPTEQTILFFKEMLQLLRDTSVPAVTDDVIEKRKLLFPLMASLATEKNNRLFSNDIYYSWFINCKILENQTEYPNECLTNWCISEKKINALTDFAAQILNSTSNYLPIQGTPKNALFNSDILAIQNQTVSNIPQYIDKWLALILGNKLYNTFSPNQLLFNSDYKINPYHLFEMIKSWNYAFNDSAPNWGKDLFSGMIMNDDFDINLSHCNFDGINFSHSFFNGIQSWGGNWSRCNLDNCSFSRVSFITSTFFYTRITNIKEIRQPFRMSNCMAGTDFKLLDTFDTSDLNERSRIPILSNNHITSFDINENISGYDIFATCSGFIKYGLQKSLFTINEVKKMIKFDNVDTRDYIHEKINELKDYAVKPPRRGKSKNNITALKD